MGKINSIFIFYVLFLVACKKDPSLWKIENLNGNTITVLGHGGMGINYRFPMNSKESLNECLSLGAQGTEMDVFVTNDSVLVLYHDQTLEERTDCSGRIKEKKWEEIKNCQYKLPILSPAKLISLSDFFGGINDVSKFNYTFDCKVVDEDNLEYMNMFANALIAHINKYELNQHCIIESTQVSFLKVLTDKDPQLHLSLYTSDFASGLEIAKRLNLFCLTIDAENVGVQDVKEAHENNVRIALFNLNTEQENLKAIEKNPDYLQTDKVDFLVNALRE